ncbi:threonine aspartase 1-like [Daphnia pulex]|uniref:threonine aspartase 1-like n=1 Tax=Daphnia pulex TaxID=6669 RepID=UPI001EE003B5|nr:threonine aspartase 1-like [Daphnia pulex]
MSQYGFVAIHLGAGCHSSKSEAIYKKLCKITCEKGAALLQEGKSALDVTCELVCILEDSPLTNAGYGSNLTESGEVECDAGIMLSLKHQRNTRFGAVSSLKSIKNPIMVAKEIILYQNEPRLLGRTPPLVLVGEGASDFAKNRGLNLVHNSTLISDKAMRKYKKYKERLEVSRKALSSGLKITVQPNPSQDTVGVICIDTNGDIASASSSGGIAMKLPGRVGQVPVYGCGCWAQHSSSGGVAVSTSGCGEQLIQTTLAKKLGQTILERGDPAFHLKELMCDEFIHSEMLSDDVYDRMGGVLVAYYSEDSIDFNMAFTTDSMVVGFMSTNHEKAIVRVSRNTSLATPTNANNSSHSSRLTMEGFIVKLIN